MFIKLTRDNGRTTFVNSDFVWQVGPDEDENQSTVFFDLAEGDPYIVVQGKPEDVAAALNVGG